MNLYFDYVSVGLGAAVKDFGEKVLESEGILSVNSTPCGNMKLAEKAPV